MSPDKKMSLDPLMMAGTTSLTSASLNLPIPSPLTSPPPITSHPMPSPLNTGHILKAALTNPSEVTIVYTSKCYNSLNSITFQFTSVISACQIILSLVSSDWMYSECLPKLSAHLLVV